MKHIQLLPVETRVVVKGGLVPRYGRINGYYHSPNGDIFAIVILNECFWSEHRNETISTLVACLDWVSPTSI